MIYFYGNAPMYTFSLKPIYEQLKAENYPVQWGGVTEVHGRDIKISCTLSDPKYSKRWRNCIFVPHSVSEIAYYQNYSDYPKGCPKLKGILTVGPKTHRGFRGYPGCDGHNLRMVGWPKGDILFGPHKKELREQVMVSLDLPYEKTVLFACSSEDYLEWETKLLGEIIPYSEGKFNILIKERRQNHFQRSNPFSNQRHIRHITCMENITPFYLVTDLLFSVHPLSSVVVEIAQVNKLSISVNPHDKQMDRHSKGMYQGKPDMICSLSDLNTNIAALLEEVNDERSREIRKKLEQFIYKPDGHATERAVKAIIELGGI